MIRRIPLEDRRDVAHNALRAGVILARARRPFARVLNMDLARRVHEPQEHARQNGDGVFLVVDVGHGRRERVDVVRECLVPDAWQAVPDERVRRVGDVKREVDGIEEGNRGTWERKGPSLGTLCPDVCPTRRT